MGNIEKDENGKEIDSISKLSNLFKKLILTILKKFKNKDENTKTVFKFFLTGEYDKKEKWLNDMSEQGLTLKSFFLFMYKFEGVQDGKKGEYTYRIELLKHLPKSPESVEYIDLLEKRGIEYVGSFLFWAYFRSECRPTSNDFTLRSDEELKAIYYKRVALLATIASCTMVLVAILFFVNSIMQYNYCKPYIAEGYSCKEFYVPYIIRGVLSLFLAIVPQAIVFPIRDWGILPWGKEQDTSNDKKNNSIKTK